MGIYNAHISETASFLNLLFLSFSSNPYLEGILKSYPPVQFFPLKRYPEGH